MDIDCSPSEVFLLTRRHDRGVAHGHAVRNPTAISIDFICTRATAIFFFYSIDKIRNDERPGLGRNGTKIRSNANSRSVPATVLSRP
jgi:hypothetical protein